MRMSSVVPVIGAALLVGVAWGCGPADGLPGESIREARKLRSLPAAERKEAFERLQWRVQYDVYRYSVGRVHPPAIETLDWVTMHGDSLAPYLREQLGSVLSDGEARDAILAVCRIQDVGTYDVVGDSMLVARCRARVSMVVLPELRASLDRSIAESLR